MIENGVNPEALAVSAGSPLLPSLPRGHTDRLASPTADRQVRGPAQANVRLQAVVHFLRKEAQKEKFRAQDAERDARAAQ